MSNTSIPIQIIPIEENGCHLFANGHINGKEASLLIDTGASQSVFDANKISQFIPKKDYNPEPINKLSSGIGTNTMESKSNIINELKIGSFSIKNYEAIIIDMTHVNAAYETLNIHPIIGVIGGDILMRYKASINYQLKILKLKDN